MENTPKTGADHAPEFNPKLKMIAAEIKKILVDNDVAGVVHLFIPGATEWTMHISPSFSCISLNATNQLKIQPPIEDPANPEYHKRKIADTVNMVANFRLNTGKVSMTFTQAEITVRNHFGIVAPKPKPGPPNIDFRKNGRGH